jgi:SHS2 domain-containing protein
VTGERYEHFAHGADIGVRGFGPSPAAAFAAAARGLTAIVADPAAVAAVAQVAIVCHAPTLEFLLVDWLNAVIFEMATRHMLFARFIVAIAGDRLAAEAWGEAVDVARHVPAVEPKGATMTELKVERDDSGEWRAQCVIDV